MTRPHAIAAMCLAAWLIACLGLARPAVAEIPADQMTATASSDKTLVFHHLRRYGAGVERLERDGPRTYRRLKAALGLETMPTIDVWIVPEVGDYFALNKRPNTAPKWAAGLSFSGRQEVVVAHGSAQSPAQVLRTFAHELAHVGVDQARGPAAVPRWFNEGFAVLMADEWTPERSERLSRAAASDGLIGFGELTTHFPSHRRVASLAYDQSFHFVRWLRQQYGRALFVRLFDRISQHRGFAGALEAETGYSVKSLQAQWRQSLRESSTFWSILSDDGAVFFGVSLLFIVAWVVVQRRRRRQMASMEDMPSEKWQYDAAKYPLPGQASSSDKSSSDKPPSDKPSSDKPSGVSE